MTWRKCSRRAQSPSPTGARCRLRVAFHGCKQGQSFQPAQAEATAGSSSMAPATAAWPRPGASSCCIPVLATTGTTPLSSYRYNPKGCWDFCGYTTDTVARARARFGQKDAPQMKAVKTMVDDLLRSR